MRAMRALIDNPDDTALVFQIIRALTGESYERLYQRTLRDPQAARILDEKRDILDVLKAREHLRGLPDGTLGREYARFLDREGIDAEGLVEASSIIEPNLFLDRRAEVLSNRLRDTHDLWHIVTGYDRDIFGEVALLAFTFAQTRNYGVGFVVLAAMTKLWMEGHRDGVRLVWRAWRRGRRAGSFVGADWEGLLQLPLSDVRRCLSITEVPVYSPFFSEAAVATR
ncbi:MAG TPA: Coq4 family protein [Candidatus Binatia bacterium]|jgi:ubiquinone biosynthesis protein COQ4